MRRQHHGRPHLVQRREQVHQPPRALRVDVAGRLVGQQQRRPRDHRPRHRHELALAHRELRRFGLDQVGEAEPAQHLRDVARDLLLRGARDPQRQRHVVERAQVLKQPEVLEHDPDPAPDAGQRRAVQPGDIAPEQRYGPARRRVRQAHQAQERGLARSARADQKVKAAAREREIDVPQHLVTGAVTHPDRLQPQDGRAILVHRSTPPLAGPRREVCTDARMRLGDLQPKG